MDIPRFQQEHLDRDLAKGALWEAFEKFVGELLLLNYPGLRTFQHGNDGAIDLSHTSGQARVVVQCKQIGADDKNGAEKEWKKVAKLLEKNLKDPAGPPSGQAQYRPWYGAGPAITRFIYCVSSQFRNQDHADNLKGEIREVFRNLANEHGHLSHLASIEVEVFDWNRICNLLREPERKHLVYRWFREKRQPGLLPLSDAPRRGSFRAYLSSSRLPYYSLSTHLEAHPAPEGTEISDEGDMLGYLEGGQTNGLIVSGSGGVGKTRLTLEIGRIARESGWIVFHAARGLKHDDLSRLAKDLTPKDRVLILIDYVELQPDFDLVVEQLNLLNENHNLQLRYVANCRESYYSRIEALEYMKYIGLSPPREDKPAHDWFEHYRRRTVRHILEQANGLPDADKYLSTCGDSPILAVFLSYLHCERKVTDLHDLLGEKDFGTWIMKRVQVSFGEREIGRDLAILVSLFPMADATARGLDSDRFRLLFDLLGKDGWIECSAEPNSDADWAGTSTTETTPAKLWVSAHDVLVDGMLSSFLRSVSPTVSHFVDELLETATGIGCLRSALISFQRLADSPVLGSVNWEETFSRQMAARPEAWRAVRDFVVRTSLLTWEQILSLLSQHEDVWDGYQEQAGFHGALGWIGRRASREEGRDLDAKHRATLLHWIKRAAPHARTSNAVITAGLLLSPESVRGQALAWISGRPTEFQTHYLLVAWLNSGLPRDQITEHVRTWTAKFDRNMHLSFVVRAWLEAGGDKVLVESSTKAWLAEHRTRQEAQFVYKSWLDAGGDKDVVAPSIEAWLAKHKATPEAGFVYKSWLDAGGEKDMVAPSIEAWLEKHQTAPDAQFVYKSWLDAGGDKDVVAPSIEPWLAEHQAALEAGFVYQSWLNAGGDKDMVAPSIEAWLEEHQTAPEAQFVYKSWLDAGGAKGLVAPSIEAWLAEHQTALVADFVIRAWLEAGGDFMVARSAAIGWLRRHRETRDAVYVTKHLAKQRDLPAETVADILMWCRCHPGDADVLWRLTGLSRHLFRPEIREALCDTAEIVVRHQLVAETPPDKTTRGQIASLFSFLTSHAEMRTGPLRNRVDRVLCECLRHTAIFGRDTPAFPAVQRTSYVQRLLELIDYRELDVEADEGAIRRFLEWVDTWQPERKAKLRGQIAFLQNWHPGVALWDIVSFD